VISLDLLFRSIAISIYRFAFCYIDLLFVTSICYFVRTICPSLNRFVFLITIRLHIVCSMQDAGAGTSGADMSGGGAGASADM